MAWGGLAMVVPPAVCICGTCMTGERYTFARRGQHKLLSFGMFPFQINVDFVSNFNNLLVLIV